MHAHRMRSYRIENFVTGLHRLPRLLFKESLQASDKNLTCLLHIANMIGGR